MGIIEWNYIADVPQKFEHAGSARDNIGLVWPPSIHPEYRRLRGIFPGYITTENHRSELEEALAEARSMLFEDISRFTIKALINREQLHFLIQKYPETIEAVVPLSGTQDRFYGGYYVYLGQNHPTRRCNQDKSDAYNYVFTVIGLTQQTKWSEYLTKIGENEFIYENDGERFKITLLSETERSDDRIIDQMKELYMPFGYNEESVKRLLTDNSNTIAVARNSQGVIVATSLIQEAQIPIDGCIFTIGEITEASTHRDYGKRGLYRAVSSTLILCCDKIDLLIGECNTDPRSLGVLKTAVSQGRGISAIVSRELGLHSGILWASVPIAGPGESPDGSVYNNLAVTFMTREMLNVFQSNYYG